MVLDSDKSFLVILVFSALIIGAITMYFAVNHQQNIDNQILSGTIHMLNTTKDGVEPTFKENYDKNKIKLGRFDYNHNMLSDNPTFGEWNNLAKYIYDRYYDYNAFIIEGLDKPIIFTDGNNVFSSVLLASQTKIPEVMISSNNKLFRAVRSLQYGFNNFSSTNYYPLSNENSLKVQYNQQPALKYINNLVIPIIKVFPGIDDNYMNSFMNNKNIHGIVLELKGTGLGPINNDMINSIRNITKKGIVIVCVPESKVYTGNGIDIRLVEAGCLDGGNITTETAYIKLAFLLSQSPERKLIGKLMEINFRGEIDVY